MVALELPEIPASLKSIQQHLKIASAHDERDPVVSYWCRLYALQTGLKLSKTKSYEMDFLLKLMDWLETTKKEMRDNKTITSNVAAREHLENWALKLFLFADKNDRASNFGKNVVQSFFTAGLLYDVLTLFGELTEEAARNRKYAKWKAAYIYNCLKDGKTPAAGPMPEQDWSGDLDEGLADALKETPLNTDESVVSRNEEAEERSDKEEPAAIRKSEGDNELSLTRINEAQKLIKWAGSALTFEDVPTAVLNLQKALHLLTAEEK